MDNAGDNAGVWLSYSQLAEARAIKRDGARRLAQRHRWRRHVGNDGEARVLVPPEWLPKPGDNRRDSLRDKPPPGPDMAGVVTALQGAVDTLRQQLGRAEARSDAAERAAREAREAAEALRRADAARRDKGLVARLLAAWRRE